MKKIIITGTPRTGTTALCSLLSHSTNVLVTNESGVFEQYPQRYYKRRTMILADNINSRLLELKGLTERDIDNFFIGNFENKGNIEFFGDKYPDHCLTTERCNAVCEQHPDAYFLFTYRNPCAVVYSGMKRSEKEKDEHAGWFFFNVEDSTQKIVSRTSNWLNLIFPNVKNKIIINYDYYINNVNLLINDLNSFLDTKLDIHIPEPLYQHHNPNAYKDEMSQEMIDYITTETQSLDKVIQTLIKDQVK